MSFCYVKIFAWWWAQGLISILKINTSFWNTIKESSSVYAYIHYFWHSLERTYVNSLPVCYCNSRNALDEILVLPVHTACYFPKLYQFMRYLKMFSELIPAWGQAECKEELSRIVCIKCEQHRERMDQIIRICKSFVSPPVTFVKLRSSPNGSL